MIDLVALDPAHDAQVEHRHRGDLGVGDLGEDRHDRRRIGHTRSSASAIPWPTPMHIVASA